MLHVQRDEQGLLEVYETATNRSLYFGNDHRQSSFSLQQPDGLALHYTRNMLTALLFNPAPQHVLLLGLGGGSLARFLLAQFPECRITALESRAAVVSIAQRFFHLPQDPRLDIITGDGVHYIANTEQQFDLILVDAFDPEGVHPGVCSPAFFSDIQQRLAARAVMSMNLWTTNRRACKATLNAMRESFDKSLLTLPLGRNSNLIALGLKGHPAVIDYRALREPARILRRQLGLDLPGYLQSLQRHNTSLFARILQR